MLSTAVEQAQLASIVAAEQRHLRVGLQGERAQPLLIGAPGFAIAAHHPLVETQAGRAVTLRLAHLLAVKPGVAAVQQPAVALAHRDARMPQRVAGQRHQQHLVVKIVERPHRIKAEPALAAGSIAAPAAVIAPLLRTKTLPLQPALPHWCRIQLPLQQMHACVGKVADAARMVEIEMRQDNMAYILWFKTEIDNLLPCAEFAVELNIVKQPKKPDRRWPGRAISCRPKPVSTSTSPCASVSSSRQWQLRCAIGERLNPS